MQESQPGAEQAPLLSLHVSLVDADAAGAAHVQALILLLEQTTAAAEAEDDTAAASEWTIMRASRPTEGRAGVAALLGPVRAQLFFTLLALLPWLCAVRERAAAAVGPPLLELQTFPAAGAGTGELGAEAQHEAEDAARAAEAVMHRPRVPHALANAWLCECRRQNPLHHPMLPSSHGVLFAA